MPMIDVYAVADLFPEDADRQLAEELTHALLRAEGVSSPGPTHLNNTGAFIHRMPPSAVNTAATGAARTVRVQVLTPPGVLQRAGQKQLVSEITQILLGRSAIALIAIFMSLLVLPISLTVLMAALVAWPFVLDIFWPSQQRRIVELEPAFRGLALAITASFLFTGIAAGSALGGALYPRFGFSSVLLMSIVLLGIGMGTLLFSVRAMQPRKTALALAAMALIGFGGKSVMARSLRQSDKKEMVRELLKGLETRDQKPLGYINPAKYVQDDPNVEDGLEGLKKFLASLPADTKVNTVRIFADGDYVVAHSEYELSGPKVGFDIFRFENGKIVEHWSNLEANCPQPNGSGRTQTDGPVEAVDLHKTEANKALLKEYFEVVVIGEKRDQATKYRGALHQHNCYGDDDRSGFQTKKGPFGNPGFVYKVHKVHKILGEGSFVLVVNEGLFDNKPTSFYDFYRVADGKIVEHWDVLEAAIPREQSKNANGKF
jgi:predicted SnoaL-like aldol condensation-catalyzing enzyme